MEDTNNRHLKLSEMGIDSVIPGRKEFIKPQERDGKCWARERRGY